MTGRGIDQILPHPSAPQLHEPQVASALTYVELAEAAAGKLPRRVSFDYVWGDTLPEIERMGPHARIANLETAVTTSNLASPGKFVHYRMHPANAPCLSAARLDCCVLANNHVLDWGRAGLEQTLVTLHAAGIRTAGAGRTASEASAPAELLLAGGQQVLVFGIGLETSGIPASWRATRHQAGVNLLADGASLHSIDALGRQIARRHRARSIAIASIHWGGNWGFEIPQRQRALAHALIDHAGVALVHGHSSHHIKGIEVYRGRPILYGCGDLLNDYEGIGGYESFRADLGLMYFATLDAASGALVSLSMIPTRIIGFRIRRAEGTEARWLRATLNRECQPLGGQVTSEPDGTFALQWS